MQAFRSAAKYGLDPFQPALIALWRPSMFAVAVMLGWIVSGGEFCQKRADPSNVSTLIPEESVVMSAANRQ